MQQKAFTDLMPKTAPIVIQITGRGPIPSFKNRKRTFAWIDKASRITEFFRSFWWIRKDSIKIMARPITEEREREWMESAILSIESQLRCALAITADTTRTAAALRSLIASRAPLDDSWTWCPEVTIKSELCEVGQEGATIEIVRLD